MTEKFCNDRSNKWRARIEDTALALVWPYWLLWRRASDYANHCIIEFDFLDSCAVVCAIAGLAIAPLFYWQFTGWAVLATVIYVLPVAFEYGVLLLIQGSPFIF